MRLTKRPWLVLSGAALVAAVPAIACANAGVPMLAVAWPLSWAALIPIVGVEGIIGRKIAAVSWGRALLAAAAANAVSTFLGIPLTWAALLLVQIVVPNGGGAAISIDTVLGKLFAVTVQAPWLIPWETDLYWMVPAALLFMLPFFGIVSVFAERPIFRLVTKCDKDIARRWSWQANLTTYGIMIVAVALWLVAALVIGK